MPLGRRVLSIVSMYLKKWFQSGFSTAFLASLISIAASADQPNVILVITDDQGYGDIAAHGNPIIKTPALDSLHGDSVRLTDYHVSPTCAPTRGALMSGHYTNRAGPWHTIMGRSFLRVGEMTLGQAFLDNGYETGMFGKWHLGDNYPYRPEDRGFSEVVRHGGGGVGQTPDYWDNSYFDDTYWHNSKPKKYEGYCTDVYFQETKRFIQTSIRKGKPFFAYICTNAPHGPFHCPEKYWKPYLEHGMSEREAIFYGMIENIDENVGAMRAWLEEEGLAENTIFIFTTDNGTATGENLFSGGMRGKKGSEYDGGHRVPFFMHWPEGNLVGGRDVDTLTAHIDVLPTLIDLCGLVGPMDYSFDGRTLTPLLYQTPTAWPDRVIITDSQRVRDPIKWRKSSVMTERWRLINGTELYDIEADPEQKNDIAKRNPETVKRLRDAYDRWWDSISPSFVIDERPVLGNDAENPTQLTSHDWLTDDGTSPWNQGHIRRGQEGVGYWAVRVEQAGTYKISLRRWPQEISKGINEGLEPGDPVPGLATFRETPGKAFDFTRASLNVADFYEEKPIEKGAESVTFTVDLKPGDFKLRGIFQTGSGSNGSVSSYYAVVERL